MEKSLQKHLTKKLYNVNIGAVVGDSKGKPKELKNMTTVSVVAVDAEAAIKRARLKKDEFVQSVEFVQSIDKV